MDDELERAIEEAGRDAVFKVMVMNGWVAYSHPPKWVWWEAIREARQAN